METIPKATAIELTQDERTVLILLKASLVIARFL